MKNLILIIFVLLAFFAGLYVYSSQKLDIHLTVAASPSVNPPSAATIKSIKENLQSATEKSAKCPNILVKSGEVLLLYNNTDTHNEMPVIFNGLDEYVNYIQVQRQKGIRCPVLFLNQETSIQGEDVYRIKSTPFNDEYETFSGLDGMTIPSKSSSLTFPPPFISQLSTNVTTTPFYNIEAFDGGMGSPAPFATAAPAPAPLQSTPTIVAAASAPVSVPAPTPTPTPASVVTPQPTQTNEASSVPSPGGFVSPYNKGGYPGFDPQNQTIGKYTDLDKLHDSTAAPPLSDNPMDPNWGGTQYTKDAVESGKYIENSVYPVNFSMPGGVQFYPGLYQTYPDPPNYVKTVGGPVPPYLQ